MAKYLILGDGFLAKKIFFFLKKKNFVILKKIEKPLTSDNPKIFYRSKILNLLRDFNNGNIINCSASLKPDKFSDFYFNSNFDLEFQKFIKKTDFNIKYINIGSAVIFSDQKSKYAISKKINYEKVKNSKNFITIIPDLILDKNNSAIKKFLKIIKNPFLFFLILPKIGKIYYPIKINNLLKCIESISLKNNISFYKFAILGEKKSFNQICIHEIDNIGIKKIIININIKTIFNFVPLFIKNYMNNYMLLNSMIDTSDIKHNMRKDRNIKIVNKFYENCNF
jgi:hypothetical protein